MDDLVDKSRRMFFLKSGGATALAAGALASPLAGCAVAPAAKAQEEKNVRALVYLTPGFGLKRPKAG